MDEIERPYDGCGKCLLGVRRLSRVEAATTSPERQREDVLTAAAAIGGHTIDREASGATDPMTRPKLGPWLRDERGKYDGLVAAAVDRSAATWSTASTPATGCKQAGGRPWYPTSLRNMPLSEAAMGYVDCPPVLNALRPASAI